MAQTRNGGIRTSCSLSRDPVEVARDLYRDLQPQQGALTVFFCSHDHDLPALQTELSRRFHNGDLIGCSCTAQIAPRGYLFGSTVAFTLPPEDFVSVSAPLNSLCGFSFTETKATVRRLRHELDRLSREKLLNNTFAFLLIDGTSSCEDIVVSAISSALGDMPLFGGSSSGDLSYDMSWVFCNGQFQRDCAVLTLIRTNHRFKVFSSDHFVSGDAKMVVTEADPAHRIVSEINAEPAASEYARIVGIDIGDLTPMVFATNPVMVKVGGRYYARSIKKVNDDGSLNFFCAIDKGIVLTVAKGTDILSKLDDLFLDILKDIGRPELIIGCDCILRSLELEQRQLKHKASRLFADYNVIGFNTFGEQIHAMHVNQTFTGIAIGGQVGSYSN
ncbi:MAG: FIST C-terminal domain-containing protein [Hyphomicrobiales bacterium]|nr:FIST C-terminal domain-containing protein [Hyphomicrobiales bacterium]